MSLDQRHTAPQTVPAQVTRPDPAGPADLAGLAGPDLAHTEADEVAALRRAYAVQQRLLAEHAARYVRSGPWPVRAVRRAGRLGLHRLAGRGLPLRAARATRPVRPGPPRVLVVVHVHYPQLWAGIAARLDAIPAAVDLVVTTSPDRADGVRAALAATGTSAEVVVRANRGRDVAPFLHVVRGRDVSCYDAVLKLHTKLSPHTPEGEAVGRRLVAGLLPGRRRVAWLLRDLSGDPAAGVAAAWHSLRGPDAWCANEAATLQLITRGPLPPLPGRLLFPAGSMFWATPAVVARLAALPVADADFDVELGQLDGTAAHAVERAVGLVCQVHGEAVRSVGASAARGFVRGLASGLASGLVSARGRDGGTGA